VARERRVELPSPLGLSRAGGNELLIENSLHIGVAPDTAWSALTDLEMVASCFPGAQLTGMSEDGYHGAVKVKLGPISMQYKGVARFVEQDAAERRAVIEADARETRGQGGARATITAAIHADQSGSRVDVTTDLSITGRAAQFGGNMIAEVGEKLMAEFAQRLQERIAAEPASTSAAPGSTSAAGSLPLVATGDVAGSQEAPNAPINLLRIIDSPTVTRFVGFSVASLVTVVLLRRWRCRG
jgi:carbon monoxide dehydrogenase subunit G